MNNIQLYDFINETEFESLICSLFNAEYNTNSFSILGKKGQSQWGVDVFSEEYKTLIQCKYKEDPQTSKSYKQKIKDEIFSEANKVVDKNSFWIDVLHKYDKFIYVSTYFHDADIQIFAQKIKQGNGENFPFSVLFIGWDQIKKMITRNSIIAKQFFPTILNTEIKDYPKLNNKIIGRENLAKEITSFLTKNLNNFVFLCGISGIGKTSIVRYVISEKTISDYFENIIWVDAISNPITDLFIKFSNYSDYIEYTYNEEISNSENSQKLVSQLNKLTGNNLLIIDNINDLNSIHEIKTELEKLNWKIIFISKIHSNSFQNSIEIEALNPQNALELFLSHFDGEITENEKPKINLLLKRLDYHTLFIELIGKLLNTHPTLTISELEKIIETEGISSNKIQIEIEYSSNKLSMSSIENIFINIFELQFSMLNQSEIRILKYFTILPSKFLNFKFLINLFDINEENTIDFINNLNSLVLKGLLILSNKEYKCHQLIQDVIITKFKLGFEDIDKVIIKYENILETGLNLNLEYQKKLLPISSKILKRFGQENIVLTWITENTAVIYDNLGLHQLAIQLNFDAIKVLEEKFTEYKKDLSAAYNNIGINFDNIKNHEKALEYKLKCLNIRKELYEENHAEIIQCYNHIAISYENLDNIEKAIEYTKIGFELAKNVAELNDENRINFASACENLAWLLMRTGQPQDAERYLITSYEIHKNIFGEDDFRMITVNANLADNYYFTNNFQIALIHINKAIEIIERNDLNKDNDYYNVVYKTKEIIEDEIKKIC